MLFNPALPANGEPRTGYSMGEHCQIMADEWNISREEQDEFALKSHNNFEAAYANGFFTDLITPFQGLDKDNNLREGLTIEKLRSLRPAFDKKVCPGQGTLTPGNSTPLTDGASAVLLASEEWAKENNLPVQAYLTFSETAAIDFFDEKEGLLMAPAYAVPRMLDRAGLSLQDFDGVKGQYDAEARRSHSINTRAYLDPRFLQVEREQVCNACGRAHWGESDGSRQKQSPDPPPAIVARGRGGVHRNGPGCQMPIPEWEDLLPGVAGHAVTRAA